MERSREKGKHTVKINHEKLKAYIKASGHTYRSFGRKIGYEWLQWKSYLYGDSWMPYEILDKILDVLNLDDEDLVGDDVNADTLDLKRAMLDTLVRIHRKVDMGSVTEIDFLEACRTVAPYVISKVYGAGSFDSNAFAQALLAAQGAVSSGEVPEGVSEVERQQLEL